MKRFLTLFFFNFQFVDLPIFVFFPVYFVDTRLFFLFPISFHVTVILFFSLPFLPLNLSKIDFSVSAPDDFGDGSNP